MGTAAAASALKPSMPVLSRRVSVLRLEVRDPSMVEKEENII